MTTERGIQAENQALQFLQQQGLQLLVRNFRGRFGEIDLIMRDGDVLVFIEVRMRLSSTFGGAEQSITAEKVNKIKLTASQYLQKHGEQPCRFDTVFLNELSAQGIVWNKQAFE